MNHPVETILAALDARIQREIQRLRARYELSLDELRGLYISDEHVDRLIAALRQPDAPDVLAPVERPAVAIRESDARWRDLAARCDLSALDEDLLLIAIAPELDLRYETLYAYLNDDVTRKWPSADLARRLLSDAYSGVCIAAALAPGSTLHQQRLIHRIEKPACRIPALGVGFTPHPCVVPWLHGQPLSCAMDERVVTWRRPVDVTFDCFAQERAIPVTRLLNHWSPTAGPLPIVSLTGQPGAGRSRTAAAIPSSASRWRRKRMLPTCWRRSFRKQ